MSARLIHRLALVFAACFALAVVLHAQPPAPVAPHSTRNDAMKPPPLPTVKSPVEMFRDLLAMTSVQREQYLTNRSAHIRQRIEEKLAEYEAMPPAQREERLRETELHWYLLPILRTITSDHSAQLAAVPEADRSLIADRLQKWDALPPDEQKAFLKYEETMEQFQDQNLDPAAAVKHVMSSVSPEARSSALENLDNFVKLPPEQRQQMYTSFQRFFALTDAEKEKTLGALPDAQREQTAGKLAVLAKLSPEERQQYLSALSRFSGMSQMERRQFIKNAEQWQRLTPTERQAWRALVKHITPQPPMPPGLIMPPMPPRLSLQVSATNHPEPTP